MTRSIARPSYLGALYRWKVFTENLLLATALKILLKTYPLLETDGAKRVLVAETIPLVSSYTGD